MSYKPCNLVAYTVISLALFFLTCSLNTNLDRIAIASYICLSVCMSACIVIFKSFAYVCIWIAMEIRVSKGGTKPAGGTIS